MRTLLVTTMIAALAACAAPSEQTRDPHMKLARELSSVQPWDIHGIRDAGQSLDFGRWEVTMPAMFANRHAAVGGGAPLELPGGPEVTVYSGLKLSADQTLYDFMLTSEAEKSRSWLTECSAMFRRVSRPTQMVQILTVATGLTQPGYPHLDCKFSGWQTGRLSLHANFSARHDTGSAEFAGRSWELRSVNVFADGHVPWKRFGYEIARDGHVVAAVECIGYGQIWMQPDLTPVEEDELAVVTTTLLYYATLLEEHH
jgi:hypothetical protein